MISSNIIKLISKTLWYEIFFISLVSSWVSGLFVTESDILISKEIDCSLYSTIPNFSNIYIAYAFCEILILSFTLFTLIFSIYSTSFIFFTLYFNFKSLFALFIFFKFNDLPIVSSVYMHVIVKFSPSYWVLIISSIYDCLYLTLQTLFSLYLQNKWTNFYKLSCTRKSQIKTICTYIGYIRVTTNNWDIRP